MRKVTYDELRDNEEEILGFSLEFVLSCFDYTDDNYETLNIPDMDSPFKFQGHFVLQDPYTWNADGRERTSKILVDPTWGEVLRETNELFKVSNDGHHVFLEDWSKGSFLNGVQIIECHYGS